MRRTIFSFLAGMTLAAACVNAISVYAFHDVDKELAGGWNEAYLGLCLESVIFAVVVGGPVWLLTLLGRQLFRLKGSSPRPKLGFLLGVAVLPIQYLVETTVRILAHDFADLSRSLYIVFSIIVCTAVLLRDNSKQVKSTA